MYFDNFLQGRNTQGNDSNIPKYIHPTTDKITTPNQARLNTLQNNFVYNKGQHPYTQTRADTSMTNQPSATSTNEYKKNNQPLKPQNNGFYTNKQEIQTSNNYLSFQPIFQKMAEDKKYVCLSPAKITNHASSGLGCEQAQTIKNLNRKSESINEPNGKDTYNGSNNLYPPSFRQTLDYTSQQGLTNKNTTNNSPFQLNFNNSLLFNQHIHSKINGKEGNQTINFKRKEEQTNNLTSRTSYHIKKQYTYTPYIQQFKGDNSNTGKTIEQTYKNQSLSSRYVPYNQNNFKLSSATTGTNDTMNRKDSLKQPGVRNFSSNKHLDNIQKDIQKLKLASKQADQIYDREINKNTYLNRLLEQKGVKPLEDEKTRQNKQKIDMSFKIIMLQKDIEDKCKQLADKTRQICEKSKIIIDKNKIIDGLLIQIRQSKNQVDQKDIVLKKIQKEQLIKVQKFLQIIKEKQQQLNLINQQQLEDKINKLKLQNSQKNEQIELDKALKQSMHCQLDQLNKRYQAILLQKDKASNQLEIMLQQKSGRQLQISNLHQKLKSHQQIIKNLEIQLQQQKIKSLKHQILISDLKAKQNALPYFFSSQRLIESQKQIKKEQKVQTEQEKASMMLKIVSLQQKLNELSILLCNQESYNHDSVVKKLKQLKEYTSIAQNLRLKQQEKIEELHIQRLHYDYLQKKYQQLTRQLKRVNNRLFIASTDAQLGMKLLKDANNQIVIMNLFNLNQKYKSQKSINQ